MATVAAAVGYMHTSSLSHQSSTSDRPAPTVHYAVVEHIRAESFLYSQFHFKDDIPRLLLTTLMNLKGSEVIFKGQQN